MSSIWCLLPVKRLRHAKQRLDRVLQPDERTSLAHAMALDVFAAAAATRRLAGIAVITADSLIAGFAHREGFRVIADETETGFRAAAEAGARILGRSGARGILVLPADIPLATANDIDALLSEHDRGHDARGCAVTIVPAAMDGGSNALAYTPIGLIPFYYGPQSFQLHCRACYASGVVPRVVAAPNLARDIDRPSDLVDFFDQKSPTRSHDFLAALAAAKLRRAIRIDRIQRAPDDPVLPSSH
jgi:2-phospho-L-lactate/phosphoenolpyruvate guanylyltransferase